MTIKKQWTLLENKREIGYECLAFHRGKWVHVKWSQYGWSLGYGKAFMSEGLNRLFSELPENTPTNRSEADSFYGWKK